MTIGVDRIDRKRVERLLKTSHFEPRLICTSREVSLFKRANNKTLCFALLFGAKEATSKALRHRLSGPSMFKSYEVFFRQKKPFCKFLASKNHVNNAIYSINMYATDVDGWAIVATSCSIDRYRK